MSDTSSWEPGYPIWWEAVRVGGPYYRARLLAHPHLRSPHFLRPLALSGWKGRGEKQKALPGPADRRPQPSDIGPDVPDPTNFFWPLFGLGFPALEISISSYVQELLTNTFTQLTELAGLLIAVGFGVNYGLYKRSKLHLLLTRGQIMSER